MPLTPATGRHVARYCHRDTKTWAFDLCVEAWDEDGCPLVYDHPKGKLVPPLFATIGPTIKLETVTEVDAPVAIPATGYEVDNGTRRGQLVGLIIHNESLHDAVAISCDEDGDAQLIIDEVNTLRFIPNP